MSDSPDDVPLSGDAAYVSERDNVDEMAPARLLVENVAPATTSR